MSTLILKEDKLNFTPLMLKNIMDKYEIDITSYGVFPFSIFYILTMILTEGMEDRDSLLRMLDDDEVTAKKYLIVIKINLEHLRRTGIATFVGKVEDVAAVCRILIDMYFIVKEEGHIDFRMEQFYTACQEGRMTENNYLNRMDMLKKLNDYFEITDNFVDFRTNIILPEFQLSPSGQKFIFYYAL